MKEIEKYRKNEKYAKIAVVFNHGINDLRDINGKQDLNDRLSQYVSYMKKLGTKLSMKNCSLYYMSVNPINGGEKGSTKNRKCEDVRTFNSGLAGELGSQYHYIDVYSYLMRTGYVLYPIRETVQTMVFIIRLKLIKGFLHFVLTT